MLTNIKNKKCFL